MKTGDIVKVYEDPAICEKFEGDAELLGINGPCDSDMEYWTVKFISDGYVTDRWINTDNN